MCDVIPIPTGRKSSSLVFGKPIGLGGRNLLDILSHAAQSLIY